APDALRGRRHLDVLHAQLGQRVDDRVDDGAERRRRTALAPAPEAERVRDRKSTRLNSSHVANSYAVFCLKKKRRAAGILRIRIILYYHFHQFTPFFFPYTPTTDTYPLSLHDALPICARRAPGSPASRCAPRPARPARRRSR